MMFSRMMGGGRPDPEAATTQAFALLERQQYESEVPPGADVTALLETLMVGLRCFLRTPEFSPPRTRLPFF